MGFSDRQIATLVGSTEDEVRALRKKIGLVPSYRLVDTCAAEFEAYTPYYYSTYDRGDDEVRKTDTRKVMILGGGPNRIGQGIEFDYCCVHAAFALKEDGFETIMVNSNPETVSTDYDTSDKLFFEPLTLEDVLHIYEREKCWGAIAQFGGQTPLNLALGLQKNGVNIIGTSPQSIEIAEDRKLFAAMLDKLDIPQPPNGLATNEAEALAAAHKAGLSRAGAPVVRARRTRDADRLFRRRNCALHALRRRGLARTSRAGGQISGRRHRSGRGLHRRCRPFANPAKARSSSAECWSTSNLPGCHSGDAAMVLPPHTLSQRVIDTIRRIHPRDGARIEGHRPDERAIRRQRRRTFMCLEVNPRASRTVPFVSKAIGVPLAKLAAKVMAGKKLTELGFTEGNLAEILGGEGIRFPVQPFSRPGHFALARNAFDRRSHGLGRRPGRGLRQIANGRQRPAAAAGTGLHQRQRLRQETRGIARERFPGTWL